MLILGIGDHLHDPSVCLMQDNQIIAAIEYERICKIKHSIAIDTNHYHIHTLGNYFKNLSNQATVAIREERYQLLTKYCLEIIGKHAMTDIDLIVSSCLFENPAFPNKTLIINHHLAHAASTFYSSTFTEAAILIIDGYGNRHKEDYETVSCYHGKSQDIQILRKTYGRSILSAEEKSLNSSNTAITVENSLGSLYRNITVLLGFGNYSEGTTMALSAYGKKDPEIFGIFDNHIQLLEDGEFKIDNRGIYFAIKETLSTSNSDEMKANIAFAVQTNLEKIILHICHYLYKTTQLKSLCLAGGVFLNCPVNTKILRETNFENIFIQPACGDSGIAIGCAQYGAFNKLNLKRNLSIFNPYLGKDYKPQDNTKYKNLRKISENNDTLQQLATLISEGKIIAWYNGGSEIGPRALGNRSILADPRRSELKDKLNKIKGRENFRPLAPAVLSEQASEYFEMNFNSPYMLLVANVKEKYQSILPAICHHDNSARVQTVMKDLNPQFYALIEAFYKITGIPIVINTSFNGANEPIVETISDAIECANRLELDALYINGTLYLIDYKSSIS